jgi:hypothetical protein
LSQIRANADETEVYPLLEANLDKLDDNFIGCLRWLGKSIKSQIDSEKFLQFYSQIKRIDSSKINPLAWLIEPMLVASSLVIITHIMW